VKPLEGLAGILSAYATRKDRLVEDAAILEVGDWCSGQDDSDAVRADLFRVRELVAFAALAARRLFTGHGLDYCNFDTYALTVQRFRPNAVGQFAFDVRRRDGISLHGWSAEDFAFVKPLHVADSGRMDLDSELLAGLLAAVESDQPLLDAIIEFNRANTDSDLFGASQRGSARSRAANGLPWLACHGMPTSAVGRRTWCAGANARRHSILWSG